MKRVGPRGLEGQPSPAALRSPIAGSSTALPEATGTPASAPPPSRPARTQGRLPPAASMVLPAALAAVLALAALVPAPARAADVVADVNPTGSSDPKDLTVMGGSVYFTAVEVPFTVRSLFRYDPASSEPPVKLASDPSWLWNDTGRPPHFLTVVGSRIVFAAYTAATGYALWATDGTPAGTGIIADPDPQTATGSFLTSNNHASINGTLYFGVDDGAHGNEVWRSDGTTAGTSLYADAAPGTKGLSPTLMTLVGDRIYLSGFTYTVGGSFSGARTYILDPDIDGVTLIEDAGGPLDVVPVAIASIETVDGPRALLWDANKGLFRCDGTTEGTVLLATRAATMNGYAVVSQGAAAFFYNADPVAGMELWHTDGTPEGTAMVTDLLPGSSDGIPGASARMILHGGGVAFLGRALGIFDAEVWRSDGTAEGTTQVGDVVMGSNGSDPGELTSMGEVLAFVATVSSDRELYLDLPGVGLKKVDLHPTSSSAPAALVVLNGSLYMAATVEGGQREMVRVTPCAGCLVDGTCYEAGAPDPTEPCRACDPATSSGAFSPVPTAVACDDGDPCTTEDACLAGTCVAGGPLACDDGNPCTDDGCDPASGCTYTPNAAPCDDGDGCTTGDVCANGECSGAGGGSCDDGNPCTDDGCDPATGCTYTENTAPCDDGDACTFGDACTGGVCFGFPADCDDQNPCTDDLCDAQLGCTYASNTAPCDDGDPCTSDDACVLETCAGSQISCDDDNDCTTDACGPGGCTHVVGGNAGAPCSDHDPCTAGGECTAEGACEGATPLCMEEQCASVACVPATGACEYTPFGDGLPCDDGDPKTTGDACAAGECVGAPAPDVRVTAMLELGGLPYIGDSIQVPFSVSNEGSAPSLGTVVSMQTTAQLALVGLSADGGIACDPAAAACGPFALAPGEVRTITAVVSPQAVGDHAVTATAMHDAPADANPTDDVATAEFPAFASADLDLFAYSTGPEVPVGLPFAVQILMRNKGPVDCPAATAGFIVTSGGASLTTSIESDLAPCSSPPCGSLAPTPLAAGASTVVTLRGVFGAPGSALIDVTAVCIGVTDPVFNNDLVSIAASAVADESPFTLDGFVTLEPAALDGAALAGAPVQVVATVAWDPGVTTALGVRPTPVLSIQASDAAVKKVALTTTKGTCSSAGGATLSESCVLGELAIGEKVDVTLTVAGAFAGTFPIGFSLDMSGAVATFPDGTVKGIAANDTDLTNNDATFALKVAVDCGVPGADGLPCDDGNPCSFADTCVEGVCVGLPTICEDAGPCISATCDPATGKCETSQKNEGGACGDGGCLICAAGACVPKTCAQSEAATGNECVATQCSAGVCGDVQFPGPCADGQGECKQGACECIPSSPGANLPCIVTTLVDGVCKDVVPVGVSCGPDTVCQKDRVCVDAGGGNGQCIGTLVPGCDELADVALQTPINALPSAIEAGRYPIDLKNLGPAPALGAKVHLAADPAGGNVVGAEVEGEPAACMPDADGMACDVGDLESGDELAIDVLVDAPAAVVATASSDTEDPDLQNNVVRVDELVMSVSVPPKPPEGQAGVPLPIKLELAAEDTVSDVLVKAELSTVDALVQGISAKLVDDTPVKLTVVSGCDGTSSGCQVSLGAPLTDGELVILTVTVLACDDLVDGPQGPQPLILHAQAQGTLGGDEPGRAYARDTTDVKLSGICGPPLPEDIAVTPGGTAQGVTGAAGQPVTIFEVDVAPPVPLSLIGVGLSSKVKIGGKTLTGALPTVFGPAITVGKKGGAAPVDGELVTPPDTSKAPTFVKLKTPIAFPGGSKTPVQGIGTPQLGAAALLAAGEGGGFVVGRRGGGDGNGGGGRNGRSGGAPPSPPAPRMPGWALLVLLAAGGLARLLAGGLARPRTRALTAGGIGLAAIVLAMSCAGGDGGGVGADGGLGWDAASGGDAVAGGDAASADAVAGGDAASADAAGGGTDANTGGPADGHDEDAGGPGDATEAGADAADDVHAPDAEGPSVYEVQVEVTELHFVTADGQEVVVPTSIPGPAVEVSEP